MAEKNKKKVGNPEVDTVRDMLDEAAKKGNKFCAIERERLTKSVREFLDKEGYTYEEGNTKNPLVEIRNGPVFA